MLGVVPMKAKVVYGFLGLTALLAASCAGKSRPADRDASPADETGTLLSPTLRQSDGYRGIWFTLGQFYGPGTQGEPYGPRSSQPIFPYGDKYSGGLGTYTMKHTPVAIYSSTVQKTFFVYGGTTDPDQQHLLCMAAYYDHRTHQVPRPTVVHDKQGVNDPHDNPSLAIDAVGHIWVFVSGRARHRPGYKYRSLQPYSVAAFERISEEEMTYPQPHWLPRYGFLNLFTKYTGVRELYFERSPDGRVWTDDCVLAAIREPGAARGGHYQTSAARGNRVGTFFNRHPDGDPDRRTDLYYLQTNDGGKSWTTVDGRPVTVPLKDVDNPARVIDYASRGLNVYLKDMGFDRRGYPVFLYLTSSGHEPGPPNGPRVWRLTRWDGRAWQTTDVCRSDHNYDAGSLYLTDSTWYVFAPTDPGPQPGHSGGEMVLWESVDEGGVWIRRWTLTHGSRFNHNYARRPLNVHEPFMAFWADGDPTRLTPSSLYFGDLRGWVWRLPASMDTESASPTLIEGISESD